MDILININMLNEHSCLTYKNKNIYIFGDIIAYLNDVGDGELSYDTNNILLNCPDNTQYEDYLKNIIHGFIGKFAVLIVDNDCESYNLFNSYSSPGLYIFEEEGCINITSNEKTVFKKFVNKNGLTPSLIEDYLTGNHLSFREPFSFFGSYVRLPGGHELKFYKTTCSIKNINSLLKEHYIEYNDIDLINKLHIKLKHIIIAYKKHFNTLNLAFSGGLDSSIILAIIKELGFQANSYFIEYSGKNQVDSLLAHQISAYLNQDIEFIPGSSSKVTEEVFDKYMRSGFFQLNNMKYIFNPSINTFYLNEKNIITGQNADSIYAIDTFLPQTELIGVERLKNITLNTDNRKYFSEDFLYENIYSTELEQEGLINLCKHYFNNIEHEHVNLTIKSFTNSNDNQRLRNRHLYPDLINKILEYSENRNLTSTLRYIKILRNNINTAQNYNEMGRFSSLNRICPFNEGPIYHLFANYKLKIFDLLSPKTLFELLFNKITNNSHRDLTEIVMRNKKFKKNNIINKYDHDFVNENLFNKRLQYISNKLDKFVRSYSFEDYTKYINNNPARLMNLAYLMEDV